MMFSGLGEVWGEDLSRGASVTGTAVSEEACHCLSASGLKVGVLRHTQLWKLSGACITETASSPCDWRTWSGMLVCSIRICF